MENYEHILGSYDPRAYLISIPKYRVIFTEYHISPFTPVLFHEYTHYALHFHTLFSLESQIYFTFLFHSIALRADSRKLLSSSLTKYLSTLDSNHPLNLTNKYLTNHSRRSGRVDKFHPIHSFLKNEWEYHSYKTDTNDIVDFLHSNENVEIPELIFKNKKGELESVTFGEEIINEGIAFIIESIITNKLNYDIKPELPPPYPYEILPALFHKENLHNFAGTILAYLSLQSPTPGKYFIQLLEKYRSQFSKINDELVDGNNTSIMNIYKTERQAIIQSDYFQFVIGKLHEVKDNLKSPGYHWLIQKWETGIQHFRIDKFPNFLRPFFEEEKGCFFSLNNTFMSFPPPAVVDISTIRKQDGKLKIYSYGKSAEDIAIDVERNLFFRGLKVAVDIICGQYQIPYRCPLYDYCDKNKKINNICEKDPVKIIENESFCEVGKGLVLLLESK